MLIEVWDNKKIGEGTEILKFDVVSIIVSFLEGLFLSTELWILRGESNRRMGRGRDTWKKFKEIRRMKRKKYVLKRG